MLVYEKKVSEEGGLKRHLFGTLGHVPAEGDVQLTYKDADGDVITPVENDTYRDDKHGGIIRESDGKAINVFVGDKCIIGKVESKVVTALKIKKEPDKVAYVEGENLNLAGIQVEATYADGDKAVVEGFNTVPADGTTLATTDNEVIISYGGQTVNVAITVRDYVHATMSTDIGEKTFVAGSTAPVEFTFTTVANDDAGIIVKGISDFGVRYEDKLSVLDYFNGTEWEGMIGREFGGQGFPMMDATAKFRAAFAENTAGDYSFTASMKRVDDSSILCSVDVPFIVAEA